MVLDRMVLMVKMIKIFEISHYGYKTAHFVYIQLQSKIIFSVHFSQNSVTLCPFPPITGDSEGKGVKFQKKIKNLRFHFLGQKSGLSTI